MQQADRAHSATGTIASPGKIEHFSASRRGVLGALAALPAIAIAVPIAAISPPTHWHALTVRFETAAKAAADYDEFVWLPEMTRVKNNVGDAPPLWFEQAFPNGQSYRYAVDLNKPAPFADPALNERHDYQVKLRNDWESGRKRIEQNEQTRAIYRCADALHFEADEARTALMRAPAPDATALLLKVQLMLANDDVWDADREAVLADIARLAA